MILVYGLAASLIIAFVRKGKFTGLAKLNLKRIELVFLALLSELSIDFFSRMIPGFNQIMLCGIIIIEYTLLFIFIWLNRNHHGIPLMGIGMVLNFVVIMVNHGIMPVSNQIMKIASLAPKLEMMQSGAIPEYMVMSKGTRLGFLGDVLFLPIPSPVFMSIGDILLGIGVFILIQKAMLSYKSVSGKAK